MQTILIVLYTIGFLITYLLSTKVCAKIAGPVDPLDYTMTYVVLPVMAASFWPSIWIMYVIGWSLKKIMESK